MQNIVLFSEWLKNYESETKIDQILNSFTDIDKIARERNIYSDSIFSTCDLNIIDRIIFEIDNNDNIRVEFGIRKFMLSVAIDYYKKWINSIDSSSHEINKENADPQFIDFDHAANLKNTIPIFAEYKDNHIESENWIDIYSGIISFLEKKHHNQISSWSGMGDIFDISKGISLPVPDNIITKNIGENLYLNVSVSPEQIPGKLLRFINICNVDKNDVKICFKYIYNSSDINQNEPESETENNINDIKEIVDDSENNIYWDREEELLLISLYIYSKTHSVEETLTETQFITELLRKKTLNNIGKDAKSIDSEVLNKKLQSLECYFKNPEYCSSDNYGWDIQLVEEAKNNLIKILLDAEEIKINLKY